MILYYTIKVGEPVQAGSAINTDKVNYSNGDAVVVTVYEGHEQQWSN